jgi:hypothetical protein
MFVLFVSKNLVAGDCLVMLLALTRQLAELPILHAMTVRKAG